MELTELLTLVAKVFDELSIPYFITGSCASITYGEPRLTNDIDVVADIHARQIAALMGRFPTSDFYISEEAVNEAIAHRRQFNIIHPISGLKVDVIIPKQSDFGDRQFERRRILALDGTNEAAFASPEDVILSKMEFYREGGSEKHLRDTTGILKVSGAAIDRKYVAEWAKRLQLEDIWQAILKRIGG